jgi:hypothetical protein
MKKHIYSVIAFAVFATSALASPVTDIDVKVPFEFKAGASTLPAGTYRVTEANSGYLLIRGEKGGVFVPRNAFILDTDESGKTSVKFNRAGDKYVLQAVPSQK